MNEIKDTKLLDTYIKRNHIHSFFSDFELCYPHMTLAEFLKNTFICCDSDYRGYFYFFVEGDYKVYGNLRNGKRILYRFCNSFSVLGETEFLLDETYHAEIHTVETTNRCVAVLLDYRDIMPVLLKDAKFLHFICRVLAEKLSYFGNMQMMPESMSPFMRWMTIMLCLIRERRPLPEREMFWRKLWPRLSAATWPNSLILQTTAHSIQAPFSSGMWREKMTSMRQSFPMSRPSGMTDPTDTMDCQPIVRLLRQNPQLPGGFHCLSQVLSIPHM